jgi:hypothetical protein
MLEDDGKSFDSGYKENHVIGLKNSTIRVEYLIENINFDSTLRHSK